MNKKRLEIILDSKKYVGILLLRIFIGSRLLYGVLDNVLSWERMLEFSGFLEFNGFIFPMANAVISVYAQFFCALLVLIGYQTRIASFVLIVNFSVALIFVHLRAGDSVEGMTGALAMLFGGLTLLFTGADKISLDARSSH
ncbi:MAG: DoxX family protein [Cyclobacteriaceae bacterium]